MRYSHILPLVVMFLLASVSIGFSNAKQKSAASAGENTAPPAEPLADEPFDVMMQVIAHKRCVNCHPAGDQPHQGEDSHVHRFGIQRGEDGHGLEALHCNTCHQVENNNIAGVPGAPHWHLAPRSMGWEGLNRVEIAQAMTDPSKNGGRSITEIEQHLTEDPLVLWVFEPGLNYAGEPREKPPVSKEDYIAAVKAWVAAGAVIPES